MRQRQLFYATVFVFILLAYLPLVRNMLAHSGDYAGHSLFVMAFSAGEFERVPPHYLHIALASAVQALTQTTHIQSLALVVLVHYGMTGALIAAFLARALAFRLALRELLLGALLAFLLLTIAPLAPDLFTRPSGVLFGYFPANPHHNPTNMIVSFYALATLWLAMRAYDLPRVDGGFVVLAAVLVVLSALAKPSWLAAFLPALVAYSVWRLFTRQYVPISTLLIGFVLPSVFVLAWQYTTPFWLADSSYLALEPFVYMTLRGDTLLTLAAKLLLSLMFPLAMLVAYARALRSDVSWQLAWLTFSVGIAQAYLLMMDGVPDVRTSGNWTWGALLGAFVLFVVSTYHWLAQHVDILRGAARSTVRFWVTSALLLLHSAAGVLWYLTHLRAVNILHQ